MARVSIGTIVSITTVLALILIAMGLFGQPDIVMLRQTGQSNCPSFIAENFNLKFVNYGNNEGIVDAEVSSETLEFKKPVDSITVPPGRETIMKFNIVQESYDEDPAWLTIDYQWQYKRYFFFSKKETGKCEYENDPQKPRYYVLQ